MPHCYQVFGLRLHSDLPCPELLAVPCDRPPDIAVQLTTLSDSLEQASFSSAHVQIAPDTYQFLIKDVARYRVEHGRRILVDPMADADAGDVRLWLLGTALGALLHQRGLLPLHVSALALDGGAYAFCGDSGAGKSTLAAALNQTGHQPGQQGGRQGGMPLLTDDVGLAVPQGDQVAFHPGFPRIKLWRDALEHFGLDHRPLIRDLTRADKFHLQLDASDGFHAAAMPLRRLYLLERSEDDAVHIEPVRGHGAISLIQSHTYRPGLVRRLGRAGEHLRQCGAVARRVRVYRFRRPWRLDRLQDSLERLLAHLHEETP